MVTENQADAWLGQQIGKHLDYDHIYGQQCTDFWNYYHEFITNGESPYAHGYAVEGAKDIWDVPTNSYDKIPDSNNLKPNVGDVLVYGSSWGGGYGHVEVCRWSDAGGCHVVGENEHNNSLEGVTEAYRSWASMRGLLGVMRPKFSPEQPVIINDPLPPVTPETPSEPPQKPIQDPAPVETPLPAPTPPVPQVPANGAPSSEVPPTPVVVTMPSTRGWNNLPDWVKRIVHTVWQAAGGALLTGLTAAHSGHDVWLALFAAYTAGFAVLKAAVVSYFTTRIE